MLTSLLSRLSGWPVLAAAGVTGSAALAATVAALPVIARTASGPLTVLSTGTALLGVGCSLSLGRALRSRGTAAARSRRE